MDLTSAIGMVTSPQNQVMDRQEILVLVSHLAQGEVHPLKSARRAMVHWALAHTEGNVSQTAQLLGTSRGTIYRYARQ